MSPYVEEITLDEEKRSGDENLDASPVWIVNVLCADGQRVDCLFFSTGLPR
jgi:hypothetical protein